MVHKHYPEANLVDDDMINIKKARAEVINKIPEVRPIKLYTKWQIMPELKVGGP